MDSELRIEHNIRLLLLLLLLCLHGCGLFHSAYGVRQDKMNDADDTPARTQPVPVPMSIHTSTFTDKGDRNKNKLGGCFCGFLYKMMIPNQTDSSTNNCNCFIKNKLPFHSFSIMAS